MVVGGKKQVVKIADNGLYFIFTFSFYFILFLVFF